MGLRTILSATNFDELLNPLIDSEQQVHIPPSSSSPLLANYSMNCNLRHKTMEEAAWHEISNQEEENGGGAKRNQAFGKASVEDLMARASAINVINPMAQIDPMAQQQQQREWWQYQLAAVDQQQEEQKQQQMALVNSTSASVFGNNVVSSGYAESYHIGMPFVSMPMIKPTVSDSQSLMEAKQSDEVVDKSIERKQKRMIKNRESAARSRARKQAYINQLEEEVTRLMNKNKRLKKQKEEDMKSSSKATPKPKYQLRRTSSAPF